ncbi:PREDICTED: uncharacterized protein LOC100635115 isoform X2 [Amphimedon queenslandica]|uniref:Uncharacterized protein n=1 Tax=Amphimedon queenslandica TaxID=400682 RepID=A0AAN0JGM1_AMPQE|nr:PREDICTED: uncharacterized protein LOC100635115 isoform X2 [Amphimedon queenslandica]|eukprot:XP_019856109.1 PREDICTED: uncharacterized protein LOC100635115 isoform X2 [Amphimedon queenslandica]
MSEGGIIYSDEREESIPDYGSGKTRVELTDSNALHEVSNFDINGDDEFQNDPSSPNSSGFTTVIAPSIGNDTFGDDMTATALQNCKKTVLSPYYIFLKCIGWRRCKAVTYEVRRTWPFMCCNFFWPFFLTVLLIMSCVTQILLCFSRDLIESNPPNSVTNITEITCSDHIFSSLVILDFLLVGTYLYGLYIFRFKLSEYLSTFIETVFLGIISRTGSYSPKNLIRSLRFFLLLGLLWIVYSLCVSIMRVFAHHYERDVDFEFLGRIPVIVKLILIVVSLLGFIVFDIAYTAAVINYSMQCQLMVYYIQSICNRIVAKEWEIDEAIKQVHTARQFMNKLNGHLSRAVSSMMFIFLYSSVISLWGLQKLQHSDPDLVIVATTSILGTIQWVLWLLLPLIQAARVTHSGCWLKKTALEIRTRPFSYRDTPQLDLDSFVNYCGSIQLKAKLASIPISPALVIGGSFILGFVMFLVIELDNFSWAPWL